MGIVIHLAKNWKDNIKILAVPNNILKIPRSSSLF